MEVIPDTEASAFGCLVQIGSSTQFCTWEGDIVVHNDGSADLDSGDLLVAVEPVDPTADITLAGTCPTVPAGGSCTFRLTHKESGPTSEDINPSGTVTASGAGSADSDTYTTLLP